MRPLPYHVVNVLLHAAAAIALWRGHPGISKGLEANPHDALTHNNLGNDLVQKGQIDNAIAKYRQALDIKPDYAEADYNLGDALMKEQQFAAAISNTKKPSC